jgi:hypothetical protein
MVTQRRAYYEAISDLFYLYDDFNDRQIHHNHALQMAGFELSNRLKQRVDSALEAMPISTPWLAHPTPKPLAVPGSDLPEAPTSPI